MLTPENMGMVAIIVPVIIGISEVAKTTKLPKKFIPLLNLVLGVAAAYVVVVPRTFEGIVLVGVIAGLSASGLYSGIKNTSQQLKHK